MEIIESSQITEFVGEEFMMWLWFKTNCYDSLLTISGHGEVEVIFDNHLRLDAYRSDDERSELRGGTPAYSVEAKTALQQGKRLSKAKIRIVKEGREWLFTLTGKSLDLSGVKIPAVLSREDDEKFYERIYLLEELEEILETLYQEFVKIRLSESWHDHAIPAMMKWITSEETPQVEDYPKELIHFGEGTPKSTLPNRSAGYNE